MRDANTLDGKVQEVTLKIASLEKRIAEEERVNRDVDTIKDKIFDLKRKLGIYREVLRRYGSSTIDYRNVC